MKILAIRGSNLASLANDFDIDLARGPLGQVGLFVITGPTGAGKSTLLDALCLPLFNKTPRLDNQGGVEIGADGEAGLRDSDPRSLLRRGAVAAHAEVDFLGVDGHSYRARWSVRRARDRADGTIQGETLQLLQLPEQTALGGTKSETLGEIGARLGLSFEQFKQSVLLAQGDFAAFLKATGTKRAELLERMTGTEIYGALSRCAAEKAQTTQDTLAAHLKALEAFLPLSEDERAGLEAKLALLRDQAGEHDRLVKELDAAERWHSELLARADREKQARDAAATASADWDVAQPRKIELEAIRVAQLLRAELEAADRASAAVTTSQDELATFADALAKAQDAEARSSAALQSADRALAQASQARQAATPEIDRARALDVQILEAAGQTEAKASSFSQAADRASTAQSVAEALGRKLAEAKGRRQDAQDWLDRHLEIAPLAGEWGRWEQELKRFSTAVDALGNLGEEQSRAAHGLAAAEKVHVDAIGEAERAEQEVATSKSRMDQAEAESAAWNSDALGAERKALELLRDRLVSLENLRATAAAALEQAARQREAEVRFKEAAREAEVAIVRLREERVPLAAAVDEAERSLKVLMAAQSLDDHRARLVAGQECPLCGSKEHPWSREAVAIADALAEQDDRVAHLRGRLTELDAGLQEHQTALARAKDDAATAAAQAEPLETTAAEQLREWSSRRIEARQAWPDPTRTETPSPLDRLDPDQALPHGHPTAPDSRERLGEATACARQALEAVDAALAKAQGVDKAAKAAATAYQQALAAAAVASKAASEAQKNVETAASATRKLDADIAGATAKRNEAIATLAGAFADQPDWEAALEAAPAAFAKQCGKNVKDWTARRQAQTNAEAEISELQPGLAAAEAEAKTRSESARQAKDEAEAAAKDLAARRAERAALLGGETTASYEGTLQEALARAEQARQEVASEHDAATSAVASTRKAVELGTKALDQARRQASDAAESLRLALEGAGMDAASLRARLALGKAWVEAEDQALQDPQRRLTEAQKQLDLLASQREDHERTGQPRWPQAEIGPLLATARSAYESCQGEVNTTAAALTADDRNREQGERAAEALKDLQAAAEVWGGLAAVIGSKDGNKFRRFAQSLTLDALLALANEHLVQLSRRYRLMRVPNTTRDAQALELQVVDLDMGDEVRSTNTLSGGESFLVSLSLALGLSSLAARNTKIDSLFIDEGFGTLDPATLEVALASLDALQAAGRQVGLISHVPGLGERIGAQVKVERRGTGRSSVRIVTDGASGGPVAAVPG